MILQAALHRGAVVLLVTAALRLVEETLVAAGQAAAGNIVNWKEFTRSYAVWDSTQIKGFFGWGDDEYGFLSNFCPAPTYFEGVMYPTSEHAYMASKTIYHKEREAILRAATPAEAKHIGQQVTLRINWDEVKKSYMLAVVFDKFWRNKDLRNRLIATSHRYLEETNHWGDRYYGVDYETREGKNVLGRILMDVRAILRNYPTI